MHLLPCVHAAQGSVATAASHRTAAQDCDMIFTPAHAWYLKRQVHLASQTFLTLN
jgi:hypothetical protein